MTNIKAQHNEIQTANEKLKTKISEVLKEINELKMTNQNQSNEIYSLQVTNET